MFYALHCTTTMSWWLLATLLIITRSTGYTHCTYYTNGWCHIDCGQPEACKESTAVCDEGLPCFIDCGGIDACKSALLYGSAATDVVFRCIYNNGHNNSHTCQDTIFVCGTGDCRLLCEGGDSEACSNPASLTVGSATSFSCSGNCPYTSYTFPSKPPTTSPLSSNPTASPTDPPITTRIPTAAPSSMRPTAHPTRNPSHHPTKTPTTDPSMFPTHDPTKAPTLDPTASPTSEPTESPTSDPTKSPTSDPTSDPTESPTSDPTKSPTTDPTESPTFDPTTDPTIEPTKYPTDYPTPKPTPLCTEYAEKNKSNSALFEDDPCSGYGYDCCLNNTMHCHWKDNYACRYCEHFYDEVDQCPCCVSNDSSTSDSTNGVDIPQIALYCLIVICIFVPVTTFCWGVHAGWNCCRKTSSHSKLLMEELKRNY